MMSLNMLYDILELTKLNRHNNINLNNRKEDLEMRNMKLKSKVAGLAVASLVLGTPIAAYAIDVAGGDLYYNGGQTSSVVYSEIGRKEGITRNYMVKATVKVGGDTYTSGFLSNYAYKEANRSFWANETSYYDYYPYDAK